jgi:hypothetical protein
VSHLAALIAALRPLGPLPTINTSHEVNIGISLAGSITLLSWIII